MKKFVRLQALCAAVGIALGSAAAAAGPDLTRLMITIKPGSASQVENAARGLGGNVHHRFDELGVVAVSIPTVALNGFLNNPNIVGYEPDVERYPMGQTVPYGVDLVQARQAWAGGDNGAGVMVCVIDSGLKADHEDFAGLDVVGGYPSGWNDDTCGHGTHVAGTIAAVDNTTGVVGVSPGDVSLYILKVFNGESCGWSYSSTLIDAANRCKSAADAAGKKLVINMSLGGGSSSTTENNAFQNLYNAGVLSIAAAGNAGNTTKSYPASYASVVSVAAVDANKALASFSQRNDAVELAAPGVAVLSTYDQADGSAQIGTTSYIAAALEGSPASVASAGWVNGGRCTTTGSGSFSGKIVLCERGDIAFADKVVNAQNGGGVGVIMYNNASGGFSGTLNGVATSIPSVSISQEDGQEILATGTGKTATVDARSGASTRGYAYLDGTSMATPHVAGVAAVVWSSDTSKSNADVRAALTSSAEDLGTAGKDNSFGHGLVRTVNAISALAAGGGSGGGTDPGAPTSLTGSKTNKGPNYTYRLNWSGGASTVDIYRGATKVRSAINNSGSYSETVKNVSSATYKVCNAGSSTACASITL